jgi:hypothetical protein
LRLLRLLRSDSSCEDRRVNAGARDRIVAATAAAVLSGAPSTAYALCTNRSVFESTRAAGTLLGRPTLTRGFVAHGAISLWWGFVLGRLLPRGSRARSGLVAGAAIAALDLGIVARRFPAIRALPRLPQWADHLAFGAVFGAVLDARERRGPHQGPEVRHAF